MYLKYFIVIFKELFKFSGKLSLREFLIRMIVLFVYATIGTIIVFLNQELVYSRLGEKSLPDLLGKVQILAPFIFFWITSFLFLVNVFARRLHALGLSGYWVFSIFAPGGTIGLFLYCVLKKEPKDNSIQ